MNYEELNMPELEAQLTQTEAEINDYHRQRAELDRWGSLLQEHRTQILAAMGVGVIRVEEGAI